MQWKIIWKVAHQIIVDIEVVERLPRPENLEFSLRYVLKHANYGGGNIFQFFNTTEKPNHLVASRRRWLEETMRGRKVGETSGTTLGIKEPRQKLHRVSTALYRLLCLSEARRRPEEKKIIGK